MRRPVPAGVHHTRRHSGSAVTRPHYAIPASRPAVQLVVLSHSPERRLRLLRLLDALASASGCERADELHATRDTAAVVVVDTAYHDVAALCSSLDTTRQETTALLAVLVSTSGPAHLHTTLAAASHIRCVESVAADWHDIVPLTRAALRRADALLCARQVVDGVRAITPDWLLPFVEFCAGRAGAAGNVAAFVAHAGLKRRTLDSRIRRAGLPTAEAILGWCRILHAAWRLDRSSDSVERIAFAIGLTSASALRNYYRRYAGVSPTEARVRGGFSVLLDRFRIELSVSRARSIATNE